MQLNLDFSKPISIPEERRDQTITFRTGIKFKDDLSALAIAKGVDVSALIFEYAIQGYLSDYKNILLMQVHGDRPLREMLG
jgi:hypothetical protein